MYKTPVASNFSLTQETIKLNNELNKKEIERYNNYFVDINDKKYIEKE